MGTTFWARDYFAVIVGNVNFEDVQRYLEQKEEHHKKDKFQISELDLTLLTCFSRLKFISIEYKKTVLSISNAIYYTKLD